MKLIDLESNLQITITVFKGNYYYSLYQYLKIECVAKTSFKQYIDFGLYAKKLNARKLRSQFPNNKNPW